jgi:FkbM family methyltransferase
MSIVKRATSRLWRINPLLRVKIGEKNLLVPSVTYSISTDWKPCWKTDLIGHFLKLIPGDFIDVGANIGQTLYDFYSLNHQGRYIGFEPDPNCASILQQVIGRNVLKSYSIIPVGLSDSNTIVPHYSRGLWDPAASILARPGLKFDSIFVPIFRFDHIREALAISEIAVMKIDVEGAEQQVLAGMPETLARWVGAPIRRTIKITSLLLCHCSNAQITSFFESIRLITIIWPA